MKKLVLATVVAAGVAAAALVPAGAPVGAALVSADAPVEAATSGFGSAVSAVAQPTWQTDASVNALASTGNVVYAGGLFTRIRPGGQPAGEGEAVRSYVASFNRTTGAPSGWAPQLNGAVWSIATSPDGRYVVIGGDFTKVDGVPRRHVAMFDVATHQLVTGWDPAVSYRVSALAVFGNTVYLGGSFTRVDGVVRNRLAAVTVNTGALLPWDPDADGDVHAIDLSDDGSRVFAGGGFTTLKGAPRHSLAMLNTTNGNAYPMPAAAAIPAPTECESRVKDIDTLGHRVFVANAGSGSGCYDGILAADSTTGKLLWQSHCLGATEAIKAIGGWLYKGSHAHDCRKDGSFGEGTGTHYLLVQNVANGKFGPWFPTTDAGDNTWVGPLAITSGGNDLWVGGDFLRVNGAPQQGLTRFTNVPGGAQPLAPAAPKVSSKTAGRTTVTFPAVFDADNITLTYTLYRGSTKVGSWSRNSYPWVRPTVATFADTGVRSGQTVSYRVEASDGRNVRRGPATTVKVR